MNELITKSEVFIPDGEGNMIVSPEAILKIREIHVTYKEIDKQYKKLTKMLLEGMEENGIKKVDNEDLLITYKEPSEQLRMDNDKLWKEHKDVAFACQKFVPVKSSITIKAR